MEDPEVSLPFLAHAALLRCLCLRVLHFSSIPIHTGMTYDKDCSSTPGPRW